MRIDVMDKETEITRTERHGSITLKLEDNKSCVQDREKKELQDKGLGEIIHE